jgi:hypothetical protein
MNCNNGVRRDCKQSFGACNSINTMRMIPDSHVYHYFHIVHESPNESHGMIHGPDVRTGKVQLQQLYLELQIVVSSPNRLQSYLGDC